MKQTRTMILGAMLLLFGQGLLAQSDFTYGFKAGLNFSSLTGPLEEDGAGMVVEEFDQTTGFHVAALFNYRITDAFRFRTELMFSQKGLRYRYDGDSFLDLTSNGGDLIPTTGNRKVTLNVTNSYIDIPISVVIRPLEWLEFSAGPSVGFLVSSSAAGELIYSGESFTGSPVEEFSVTLDYNFVSDQDGEANFNNATEITVDGKSVTIPSSFGAYYDFTREEGNYYNVLDFGLNAGVHLYLNGSLFVAGRLNYGLLDATNNNYDISLVSLDEDGNRIPRSDTDRNLSFQASVGFSF